MTFTYSVTPADWVGIAPLVVLVIMALVLMLVELVLPHEGEKSKHTGPANFIILPLVSLLGILGSIAATITLLVIGPIKPEDQQQVFNHMVSADAGTQIGYLLILVAGILGVLLSPAYLKRLKLVHQGEYYALLMLTMVGMMLMAASTNFITLFLGLEMFSLALYILCSFVARRRASQESGMKYFLLSSFASAFLLYGIALIYAATNSTFFFKIAESVQAQGTATPLLLVGMGLLTVGFAFKVSGIPFHAWTPDVYEGAPAPITAFMSVGTKVAAFVTFARVFGFVLLPLQNDWMPVVWAIAVLTMVGGNIMALSQGNLKRLLAYSSIAHGGYLLIGVVVGGAEGTSAILFYLACYLFMNIGAFGVISLLERLDNTGYQNKDLRGLWYRRPVLAGLLAFFLLSLAGFPPMAGFAAKYYMFLVALNGGHPELLIIGVLTSILGIYYYLRPIATMFMQQREEEVVPSVVPASPVPATSKRVTTSGRASATAVAERPVVATEVVTETVPSEETENAHVWASWTALILAAAGTLLVGVILPFWLSDLVNLSQLMIR